MKLLLLLIFGLALISLIQSSYSDTKIVQDDYISTTITYPDGVVRGSDFNISFLIQSGSSSDRTNATLKIIFQQEIFSSENELGYFFERIAGTSSYGKTFTIKSLPNSTLGQHFINVDLSHIDLGSKIRYSSIALQITVREEPQVIIKTITQDSIYSDAEFPFFVEIESQGSDLRDVTIKIVPPEEITFRGQTLHTFSFIDRDTPITLRAQLMTASEEQIGYEHYIPFQITVDYIDDTDTKRTTAKTISLLLRPKTFFEIGAEGGFWIGDFYFTPTISYGTFIGIAVGLFGFYKWYKKRMKKQKN